MLIIYHEKILDLKLQHNLNNKMSLMKKIIVIDYRPRCTYKDIF